MQRSGATLNPAFVTPTTYSTVSDFPKWMLALAFVNLASLLTSIFFLFGAEPFGTSESTLVRFLLYIATQLLWLVPIALFFLSLNTYRRGYERMGAAIAVAGDAVTILSIALLLA